MGVGQCVGGWSNCSWMRGESEALEQLPNDIPGGNNERGEVSSASDCPGDYVASLKLPRAKVHMSRKFLSPLRKPPRMEWMKKKEGPEFRRCPSGCARKTRFADGISNKALIKASSGG